MGHSGNSLPIQRGGANRRLARLVSRVLAANLSRIGRFLAPSMRWKQENSDHRPKRASGSEIPARVTGRSLSIISGVNSGGGVGKRLVRFDEINELKSRLLLRGSFASLRNLLRLVKGCHKDSATTHHWKTGEAV